MTDLRDILAADALTPSEVGAFAEPGSRWISVDTALLLIERLHPASRPGQDSDSAPGFGGLSSRDEGPALAEAPGSTIHPAPPGSVSPGASVSSPSAVFTPPAGVETSVTRPAAPA